MPRLSTCDPATCDLAPRSWLGIVGGVVGKLRVDESVGDFTTDGHGTLELIGQVDTTALIPATPSIGGLSVLPIALCSQNSTSENTDNTHSTRGGIARRASGGPVVGVVTG